MHPRGVDIKDARDAAEALRPLAGSAAAQLFGFGFLGAAILAAAVVPLSTAYSTAEAFERKSDLNDSFGEAPLFYSTYGLMVLCAVGLVLIPGAPLVPILFLSQALNAVLLLVVLPFLRALGRDPAVMGEHRLTGLDSWLTALALGLVAASIAILVALTLF